MSQRKLTEGNVREVVLGSGHVPPSRPGRETQATSRVEAAASPTESDPVAHAEGSGRAGTLWGEDDLPRGESWAAPSSPYRRAA